MLLLFQDKLPMWRWRGKKHRSSMFLFPPTPNCVDKQWNSWNNKERMRLSFQ